MNDALLMSFLLAVLAVQITPGPGMLFILANGLHGGRKSGIAAAFGAAIGMVVHTFAAALGLAALFRYAPVLFDIVKFAGAAYLLWLAIRAFRSRDHLDTGGLSTQSRVAPRKVFVRATINNLANPKVIIFYAAFLPQFIDAKLGHVTVQFITLGLLFMLVGLMLDIVIGAFSGAISQAIRRSAAVDRMFNKIVGTIFGALAIKVLASQRPEVAR